MQVKGRAACRTAA